MVKQTEHGSRFPQWESTALKNRIFLAMLSVAFFPLAFYSLFVLVRLFPPDQSIDWLDPLLVFALCLISISLFSLYISKKLAEPMQVLRETQNQLIQAAKLASVGTLAAGVAHELNQSLMVIRGYTQMLLSDPTDSLRLKEDLGHIETQTTRMMKIIRQLKDFSRPSRGEYEWLHLEDVIENTLTMLERQLQQTQVSIVKQFSSHIPLLYADRNQLEQVFLNLIINAVDAVMSQQQRQIKLTLSQLDSQPGYVMIEIQDSGCGMSAAVQAHVFDPFFTSKEVGQGTGLGLSISYGLIQSHGGWIEVESEEGAGSLFRVILPIKSEAKTHV